jgi:hypothetical protein
MLDNGCLTVLAWCLLFWVVVIVGLVWWLT